MTSELRIGVAMWTLLSLTACSEHRDGVGLEVGVMHHPGDAHAQVHYPAGAERGFITDQGYGVVLRQAFLVVGRVELLACEPSAAQRVLGGLRMLLAPVSVARAHGLSSPTVLATPHVVDLMDEDRNILSMARMEPPPGEYCGVRLGVEAADTDAVGLPGPRDDPRAIDMVGRSLAAAGRFVVPGEQRSRDFRIESDAVDEVELPFVDPEGRPTRLTLSAKRLHAELRLEVPYYPMFDGVPLAASEPELQAFTTLRNLLGGARAVIVE
jgi:hypothetical protein